MIGILVLPNEEIWHVDDPGMAFAELSPRLYLKVVLYPAHAHVRVILANYDLRYRLHNRAEITFPS